MKLNLTERGHKLPPDIRPELFLSGLMSAATGHSESVETVGVGATGAHPKLTMRWAREGRSPLVGYVFYQH